MITYSVYLQARNIKNLSFPSDTSHRPLQTNKRWSSLEVALENRTTLVNVLENYSVSCLGLISCNVYNSLFQCYGCRQLLCSYHLTLLVTLLLKINLAMNLAYKPEELWNKALLNSALNLLVLLNSNQVSIVAVLIKKLSLHFENLNIHLVSYHILMTFASAWWPYIFCES